MSSSLLTEIVLPQRPPHVPCPTTVTDGDRRSLFIALEAVADPRDPRGRRYPLVAILAAAVCAVIAGACTFAAVSDWVRFQDRTVRARLGFDGRVPAATTVWRLLIRIDAAVLSQVLACWLQNRTVLVPAAGHWWRRVISVDGKVERGGFAPEIDAPEDVLTALIDAITDAGYTPGRDGVAIALDPAASEFYRDGHDHVAGEQLSSNDMITRYAAMTNRFPVWSIEDGLADGDWDGWIRLAERLGERTQLVGDDILVTNPAIVTESIGRRAGNAALIKVNQIGTVTETLDTMRIYRTAGWAQMVSHRSGETEDTFIADLAVGTGCGQLKTGAPARGERVAKYSRLIEIEADRPMAYGAALNHGANALITG